MLAGTSIPNPGLNQDFNTIVSFLYRAFWEDILHRKKDSGISFLTDGDWTFLHPVKKNRVIHPWGLVHELILRV